MAKAEDSLRAAAHLLQGDFPAFSISRSYYAMFYAAEALSPSSGPTASRLRQ